MQPSILLINPEIDDSTQSKVLTDIIRTSFPMSLGHLAGYLEAKTDWPVRIHDEQIDPLQDGALEGLLASMTGLKVVGVTTLTATCGRAYALCRRCKAINPAVVTVLGGIHATVLPEEGLASGGVDYVVRGEGEITFLELLRCLSAGADPGEVAGVSFLHQGRVVATPQRPLIDDLASLPRFPYHLFEENRGKYSGFNSIQSSRGCPYACIFCSQRSLTGRSYRYLPPERVIDDIRLLVEKYHFTTIRLLDDNIGANKPRLMRLLDAIIAQGLHEKVSFEAPMRGDNLDTEMLDKLKAANFSVLTFGLETCSDRLMRTINKGETVEDVTRAIRLTAAKGIVTGTTLILGLPSETRADRFATIREVNKLPLDSVRFNILTPYPGTPVYDSLREQGEEIRILPLWRNFSVQYMWVGDDIPYVPAGTSRYELIATAMLANLWFYLRPKGLRKICSKSVAGGNVVVLPRGWYLTSYFFKMARVGLYLIRRFLVILGKYGLSLLGHRFR